MKTDPEVLAISRIRKIINGLPKGAQVSVLQYVTSRAYQDAELDRMERFGGAAIGASAGPALTSKSF